ncbi:MAG: hypothetical protein KAX49_17700 [Halanaerobiales bacterium]|nr:hypothetical protein [Halanaerobiales bacterium]
MNNLRIGIIGYSAQRFNKRKARKYIKRVFDFIDKQYIHTWKTVVLGLTDLGIPALAYREAVKKGWQTEGIACDKAFDYLCFPVNRTIIIGVDWGDESKVFLESLNILIRIGGGKQSIREIKMAKDIQHIKIFEYDL